MEKSEIIRKSEGFELEIIKKLEELEKSADQVAYSGEYEKAAGMYIVIRKFWKFLRDSENNYRKE